MSKLIKTARGYLELLLLRATGSSPELVRDELQPVLDMREFYAANQLLGTSGAATVGALAPSLTDTLTFTNLLGLKAVGATLTIGAAAATNVTLAVGLNVGGLQAVPLGSIHIPAIAAAGVVEFGVIVPNWVCQAGTFIYAQCHGTAAGGDHTLDVHGIIENYTLLG